MAILHASAHVSRLPRAAHEPQIQAPLCPWQPFGWRLALAGRLLLAPLAVFALGPDAAQAAAAEAVQEEAEDAEASDAAEGAEVDGDPSADPAADYAGAGAGAVVEEGAPEAAQQEIDDGSVGVESRAPGGGLPELTVLPIHNAAGRAFDLAVGRYVMEGLVNATHLTPLPATRSMVAKMHPRPQDLHLPSTLRTLGRRLHAPYVLVVEAVGRGRPTHVFIGLVEVRSGLTLLAYRAKMRGGRLNAELGLDLAARVRAILRHPDKARRQAEIREGRKAGGDDAVEPQDGVAAGAEADTEAGSTGGAKSSGRSRRGQRTEEASAGDEAPADDVPADAEAQVGDEELPHPLLDKARIWFAIQMTQRVSRLNVRDVDGATAPNYAGTSNNSNPFFPSIHFGGEVYSGALTGQRRRVADNFGLRFDVGFAPVRSYVRNDVARTISSTVVRLEADALYRQLWLPKRGLSPDATLGVGISYYNFPLKNAAYPGVAYLAPDLRLDLNFPVHKNLGLFANIAVRPGMAPGSDARRTLGRPGKGLGLMFGVGLRGHWKMLEGEIKGRVESFGANFSGKTTLPSTPTGTSGSAVQFDDVKLRDSLKEIVMQIGWVY